MYVCILYYFILFILCMFKHVLSTVIALITQFTINWQRNKQFNRLQATALAIYSVSYRVYILYYML